MLIIIIGLILGFFLILGVLILHLLPFLLAAIGIALILILMAGSAFWTMLSMNLFMPSESDYKGLDYEKEAVEEADDFLLQMEKDRWQKKGFAVVEEKDFDKAVTHMDRETKQAVAANDGRMMNIQFDNLDSAESRGKYKGDGRYRVSRSRITLTPAVVSKDFKYANQRYSYPRKYIIVIKANPERKNLLVDWNWKTKQVMRDAEMNGSNPEKEDELLNQVIQSLKRPPTAEERRIQEEAEEAREDKGRIIQKF
ncbi:hypothetical protein [Dialister sp.]|uniref:hypothetical protein n=1 Tax=Dialister sp. TaxID=1955814 RepID=UPI003F0FEFDC